MVELAIGVLLNSPINVNDTFSLDNRLGVSLELHESGGSYIWADYIPNNELRLLGQRLSEIDNFNAGLGYSVELNNKVNLFMEAGWSHLAVNTKEVIKQEVTYTYLVSRHNVYNRPVPVPVSVPYDQTSYGSEWSLQDGFTFKVGAEVELNKDWSLSASYVILNPEYNISIWDPATIDIGGGYWTETNDLNMNSFEMRLEYKF